MDCITKNDVMEKEKKAIKKMTPKPMNTMLCKQPRDEAVKKRKDRKAMLVKDVPPTAGNMSNLTKTSEVI